MSTNIAPAPRVSLRPVEVPPALQEGDKFIKWDEDSVAGVPVTLRVDPKGFFLYWTDQNSDVDLLDLATIRDVRTGNYAKLPKEAKTRGIVSIGSATAGALEEKTVTVCYGSDFVNVNFVNFCCTRRETAQIWADELLNLAFNLNQLNASALRHLEKIHTKLTLRADKNGCVLVKNVVRVFAVSKEGGRRVEKALSEAGLPAQKGDHIPSDKFTFDDFFHFYKSLTHRTEVHALFEKLSGGKQVIQAAQLVEFLNETQRDPRLNEILHPYADVTRARDLIKQHEPNRYNAQRDQLTIDGFLRYLLSEDAAPVQQARLELSDDMDQPMAHYFINSSHNTYLTGHQITGKSSVEIYRQTLLAGCRCVELDFWNGRTEEPVIVHGYTFVPEINAREVLEAIAECAFKTSEYPVILSFENHCNSRQQAKIAGYCREIFKDMLLDSPLDSHPLEPGGELPSPAMLKRKIIIKNKRKHHHRRDEPANGHLQRTQSGCEEVERVEPRPVVEGPLEGAVTAGGAGADSDSGSSSDGEGEGGGAGGGRGGRGGHAERDPRRRSHLRARQLRGAGALLHVRRR